MPNRRALIIANSETTDPAFPKLAVANNDAQSLTQILSSKEIGDYEVVTLVNQPMRQVREQIARVCRDNKRDDVVLIYYSGYGVLDDMGDLFLATIDTDHIIVDATSVEASFLQSQLGKSRSRNKVVILDCSHSGAFTRSMRQIPNGLVVITASDASQYAWVNDEVVGSEAVNSQFTYFLLQGLRDGAARS